jgi:predicted amidophosphoribosyltransferase
MYYILTTFFQDHWDNIRNNRTSYLSRYLNIDHHDLVDGTTTIFLRLNKVSHAIEKAWLGKVYRIQIDGGKINFSVEIEREIPMEPELVRTRIGWHVIHDDLTLHAQTAVEPGLQLNVQLLSGNWDKGLALDLHTVHSVILADGHFDTTRTFIGEMLYQLKYKGRKEYAKAIAERIHEFSSNPDVTEFFSGNSAIIPVPPSDTVRAFQPVLEIAIETGKKLAIPVDQFYLKKSKATPQLKNELDPAARESALFDAFNVADSRYANKSVILIDDLYRSGATAREITRTLKEKGNVGKVHFLTITKTRRNR